jgi:hypothetical protein
MNLVEESEADCLTIIDDLLPFLLLICFILGFSVFQYLKSVPSDSANNKSNVEKSGAKIEGSFEDQGF